MTVLIEGRPGRDCSPHDKVMMIKMGFVRGIEQNKAKFEREECQREDWCVLATFLTPTSREGVRKEGCVQPAVAFSPLCAFVV